MNAPNPVANSRAQSVGRLSDLVAWLPAAGAALFILGWLGIESFFRRFGVTAREAGFGTTEAIALAGVQLAVIGVAGYVGYACCRWTLVYLPPHDDTGIGRAKVEWAGIIIWALAYLPLLLLMPGGSPIGRHSNPAFMLFVLVGLVTGGLVDHWLRTDHGATSPFRMQNVALVGAWFFLGLTVGLAPLLGTAGLKRGEAPYTRSLQLLPAVAQVKIPSDPLGCALLLGISDETYLLWSFESKQATRVPVGSVELIYERCSPPVKRPG
jgi:hypothetical protein